MSKMTSHLLEMEEKGYATYDDIRRVYVEAGKELRKSMEYEKCAESEIKSIESQDLKGHWASAQDRDERWIARQEKRLEE